MLHMEMEVGYCDHSMSIIPPSILRTKLIFFSRSATATLTVTVINLNDNPPQFVDESGVPVEAITVPVMEEILPPHTIYTLQVITSQQQEINIINMIIIPQ